MPLNIMVLESERGAADQAVLDLMEEVAAAELPTQWSRERGAEIIRIRA